MTNSNDALRAALEKAKRTPWSQHSEGFNSGIDCAIGILARHRTPSPVAGGDLRELAQAIDLARTTDRSDDWVRVTKLTDAALNQPAAPVEAVEPVGQVRVEANGEWILKGWATNLPEGVHWLYAHPPEPAASTVAVPAFATVEMVAAGLKTGSRYGPSAMRNIWREMYLATTHHKGSSDGQ